MDIRSLSSLDGTSHGLGAAHPVDRGREVGGGSFGAERDRLPAGHEEASMAARAPPQSAAPKSAQSRPAPASPAPADDVFEVPAEEMDLADLAELAKKVVERKNLNRPTSDKLQTHAKRHTADHSEVLFHSLSLGRMAVA